VRLFTKESSDSNPTSNNARVARLPVVASRFVSSSTGIAHKAACAQIL